jgi:transposase
MNHCKRLSIDLAKNVFQICGADTRNKILFNKKVTRKKLLMEVLNIKPEKIFIESCYSATYWGRLFESHGFEVGLIPAQHVKPFVKGNKNDKHDAVAILEASQRPNLHLVPIKSVEQQDIQNLHRIRQRLISNRTGLCNQIRGLLSDYGIIFAKGHHKVLASLPYLLEDMENALSFVMRDTLNDLLEELRSKNSQIEKVELSISHLSSKQSGYKKLLNMPGIGPINASAIVATIGNGKQFGSARGFAAWLGLVPKHEQSGNKLKSMGISKNGNRYLRTLLIHGARTVVSLYKDKDDPLKKFANKIKQKRGKHIAYVAVAHKMARIIWAMQSKDQSYNRNHLLASK